MLRRGHYCVAQRKVEGRAAFGASLSNAMLGHIVFASLFFINLLAGEDVGGREKYTVTGL